MKIQMSFYDPIAVAESIVGNSKEIFKKTEIKKSEEKDSVVKSMEISLFPEEFKIDFTIYRNKCDKFEEAWIKAYALI